MKYFINRMLFMLLALVILMASVVFYSYFVKSAYENVKELRGMLAAKSQDLVYYQNTIEKVNRFLSQFESDSNIREKVSLMLPDHPDIGYFTNQLVELGGINGIDIVALNTKVNSLVSSKSSGVGSLGSVTTNMSAEGSYAGLKSFVRQIENNMLIMNIDKLDITISNIAGDESKLGYSFLITSYYQGE